MFIDLQALDNIRIQFSDFEKVLSDTSESNTEYFKSLNDSIVEVSQSVKSAVDALGIKASTDKLDAVSKGLDNFSKIRDLSTEVLVSFDNVSSNLTNSISAFEGVSNKFEELYKNVRERFKEKSKPSPFITGLTSFAKNELRGVHKLSQRALTKLRLPTSKTGLVGGGIMTMVFGVTEEQRLEAQAGKAKNVIVASADSAMKGVVEASSQWLGAYAERMQKFYGIGEQEVLNIQNAFTQAGRSVSETVLTHINPALGEVGENAVTYSLALDKLFELASGTMADKAIEFSNKFGLSISESSAALTRMLAAGAGTGGVGSLKFLEYIGQATDALEGMGYKVTDIIDLTYTLSERWKEIGVPKHLAVRAVGQGVQQIASGMQGMSTEMEVVVAEYAGYGNGIAARNKFVDEMLKLSSGSKDKFKEDVVKITKRVIEQFGGDIERSRVYLEQGPGWGKKGARLAIEMYKADESGDLARVKELDAKVTEFQGQVAQSLETEQKKLTDFQLHYNEWMKGMHGIGISLLGILGDSLAVTIAFFKSLPALVQNMFTAGGRKENEKIMKDAMKYQSFDKHISRAMSSFAIMGNAVKGFAASTGLKDTFTNLGKAMFGEKWKMPERQVPMAGYIGTAPSGPQPVMYLPSPQPYVPLSEEASSELGGGYGPGTASTYASAASGYMDQYPTVEGAVEFTQQPLSLVSNGVDQEGNLNFEIVGDCPSCGLHFGESVDEEGYTEEERVLATMLESEVGSSYLKSEKGKKELAGVAFTAINRLQNAKGSKSLSDVITSGKGFGKQGKKRAYSTAVGSDDPKVNLGRSVSKDMFAFARDILQGKVENPVGKATHFLHYTKGKGYGKESGIMRALPPFAQSKKNVANIGKARFYAKSGKEAENARELDKKYISSFEEKHPGVDPLTGKEVETEVATNESIFDMPKG